MYVSEDAKLAHLSDYLIETRAEIIADKGSLTQFFVAKGVIAGSIIASFEFGLSDLIIVASPFFVMIVDFLYRKRLNEIFARWDYLETELIPQIKRQMRNFLNEDLKYFEDVVMANRDLIFLEERWSKTLILVPLMFFAPIAAAVGGLTRFPTLSYAGYLAAIIVVCGLYAFHYFAFIRIDQSSEKIRADQNSEETPGYRKFSSTYDHKCFALFPTGGLFFACYGLEMDFFTKIINAVDL